MAKDIATRRSSGMTRRPEGERDVLSLRDTINGLFEDFFTGRPMFAAGLPLREGAAYWLPAVDIKETNDEVIVYAGLPGVPKDKCEIEVRDNTLVLSGKTSEERTTGMDLIRSELPSGEFYRAFNLPADVKPEQVKAHYHDGILEIHLPKAEQSRPRKVQIQ